MKQDSKDSTSSWKKGIVVISSILLLSGLVFLVSKTNGPSKPVRRKRPKTISSKSNASEAFLRFADELTLPESKSNLLGIANEAIQSRVKNYFLNEYGETGRGAWCTDIKFFIQGSYLHGTSIRTQDDQCDIDVGVCFECKPPISPKALQQHIYNAVFGHTNSIPRIKKKCVRLDYVGLYHIDLPLYYKDGDKLYLGVGDAWELSDPKRFGLWVKENVKANEQMVRIVRYFKSWSDKVRYFNRQRMVSGIALTVWVGRFYISDSREDVSFVKTCRLLLGNLETTDPDQWDCHMPVSPNDDLLSKLTRIQRENFRNCLRVLVEKGESILASRSQEKAVSRWVNVFGRWFPNGFPSAL